MPDEDKIPFKFKKDLVQIYATGALGGFTPYDFRLNLYIDMPELVGETEEIQVTRKVENEIIMSKTAIKELSLWLQRRIEEYEKQFGEIKTTNDVVEEENSEKI